MKKATDLPICVTALLWRDGLVLSVSRKDNPTKLGLPGGKVEPGESLLQALGRELKEETGVEALSVEMVFGAVSSSGKFYSYTYHVSEWLGKPKSVEAGVVGWVKPETLVKRGQPFAPYNRALFRELGAL